VPDELLAKPMPAHFQDFIFTRELAEVYLLLDNVSTSSEKSLPPSPGLAAQGQPAEPDLIEEICRIVWPPTVSQAVQAEQAATLIRARDELNRRAAPATGATIAFTLLVAGEDTALDARSKLSSSILRRVGSEGGPGAGLMAGLPGGPPTSRFSLASTAFPNLLRYATVFRLFVPFVVIMLFILFVATSVLSWDIAAGNGVLAQWNTVQSEIAKGPDPTVAPAKSTGATTSALSRNEQNNRDLAFAEKNLSDWLNGWSWIGFPTTLNLPKAGGDATPAESVANAQWAGNLLNILGGAVLPICYGLLGAGASVVRQLSARIKESLLAPRHMTLSGVQLTLGAVIGGCIGLFVTPSGAASASAPGLLGSVPLSASALCFIAGFGVDGVFQALEGLIRRVFNVSDPTVKH